MSFDRGVYIPDTSDNHKLYKDYFKQEELAEGLIASYPKESADNTLRRLYPFVIGVYDLLSDEEKKKRVKYKDYLNYMFKGETDFIVTIRFSYYDNRNGFFGMVRDLFGWEPYSCLVFYAEDGGDKKCVGAKYADVDKIINDLNANRSYVEFIDIKFLPKLSKEVTERSDYYYHTFPEEYLYKLRKYGLCPIAFGHTIFDRIYFTSQFPTNYLDDSSFRILRVRGIDIDEIFVCDDIDELFFTEETISLEKIEILTLDGDWVNICSYIN